MTKADSIVNHVVLTGASVGLADATTNLRFLPHRPFCGCRLCGAVFQSEADRFPQDVFEANPRSFDYDLANVELYAYGLRREWSQKHAKTHLDSQHQALAASGEWATPEATQRLVAHGIVNIGDSLVSDEHSEALLESVPIPLDDAEG